MNKLIIFISLIFTIILIRSIDNYEGYSTIFNYYYPNGYYIGKYPYYRNKFNSRPIITYYKKN